MPAGCKGALLSGDADHYGIDLAAFDRAVDGLQIPFVLETRVLPVVRNALGFRDTPVPPERINDKVVVNPKFDEKLFSKLELPTASKSK